MRGNLFSSGSGVRPHETDLKGPSPPRKGHPPDKEYPRSVRQSVTDLSGEETVRTLTRKGPGVLVFLSKPSSHFTDP